MIPSYNYYMEQNPKAYNFFVQYEYKGCQKRAEIFDRITSNFVLPFWTKEIQDEKILPSGDKSIQFQVLDTRYFRYEKDLGFNLLYQDEKQLRQYQSYENYSEEDKLKLNKNDRSSLDKISQLYYFWNYSKLVFNEMAKSQNFAKLRKDKEVIEVGLFQKKIEKSTKSEKKEQPTRYLFIRSRPEEESVRKKFNKQGIVERHEKNLIISLKNYKKASDILGKQSKNGKKKLILPSEEYKTAFNQLWKEQAQSFYQIDIKYDANAIPEQLKLKDKVKKSLADKELIKLLTINFHINDLGGFFSKQLTAGLTEVNLFKNFNAYNKLNQTRNINQIDFPFKEFVFKRQKKTFSKHYSLAFQGGGAKGLAYVGAYRALKEIYDKDEKQQSKKQIPVKSIMGSSAGGIIALGVSTGIPDYELQKVCYKMKMIPSTDRFVHTQNRDPNDPFVPRDLYGLQITIDDFKQSLKDLLEQYGLISEDISNKIGEFLKSSEFQVLEQKLIKFLQAKMPTIGQILRHEVSPKQAPKKNFLQKVIYGNKQSEVKKIKINWEGLLLHGALMKGQAIHDIAAECLLKFFLKQDLQISNKASLRRKVFDALQASNSYSQKNKMPGIILQCIQQQKKNSISLLNMPLTEIFKYSPEQFIEILITIVNRFLVLINSYCHQSNIFLSHKEIDISPLVELFGIKYNKIESFLDYSTKNIQLQTKGKTDSNLNDYLKQLIYDYESLNSVLNKVNLINHKDFGENGHLKQNQPPKAIQDTTFTIKTLLEKIFPKYYPQVSLQNFLGQKALQKQASQQTSYNQLKKYFLALQGAEAISEVIDFFSIKAFKQQKKQLEKPKVISVYQDNYNKFIQQMKKITLRQYYALTGIEMTCTSVDLDDRVLRFFNHKSTPNLPVCRCVQMTGSFPIGFKAQRWRQEWGYYNIYLSRRRIQIDLTQHQFTDGGLLANFPIKYLDNADIRRKYFAHEYVQNKTLLYGFGLDYLHQDRYVPTEPQLRQIMKQTDQAQIALKDLTSYLWSKAVLLQGAKFALPILFGKPGVSVEWSKIYHKIIERIPLLRFIIKIAFAYPNADRNLNLQVFQNRVAVHELEKPFAMKQFEDQEREDKQQIAQLLSRKSNSSKSQEVKALESSANQKQKNLSREQCIDRGYIIQFEKFYGKYIFRAQSALHPIKPDPESKKIIQKYDKQKTALNQAETKKKISQTVQKRLNDNKMKYQIISKQFLNMLNQDPLNLGRVNRGNDDQNETKASQLLIEILLYNLRHSKNVQAVKKFNQQYAYYKFLIQQSTSKGLSNYQKDLNKKNFTKLYNSDQFQEISRHLSFEQFKEKHYEKLVEKESEFVQSIRKGIQTFGITRFISNYPERQRYLRNQVYAKRAQINEKFKDQELQQSLKNAQNTNDDFSCMRLYDVTEGMKRLTQFLFLVIKNTEIQKENISPEEKKEKSRHIIQLVKQNNFEKLLTNAIQQQSQKKGKIKKLTYLEIINFIRNNSSLIQLQQQFKHFIEPYEIKPLGTQRYSPTQAAIQRLHKSYMEKSFRIVQASTQSEQYEKYIYIEKHQLRDLYLHELKSQLVRLGKQEIMASSKQYYSILKDKEKLITQVKPEYQEHFFKMIYSEDPPSFFIMKQTPEQHKKRVKDSVQHSQLKVYPISNEEQERLLQQRQKIQNALFNVLIKEKSNRLPEEVYYNHYLNQTSDFKGKVLQFKQNLVKDNLLDKKALTEIGNKLTRTEQYLLKMLKVQAIQFLVRDKIEKLEKIKSDEATKQNIQSRKQSQNHLSSIHKVLYLDLQNLFVIIKQTMLLLQNLNDEYCIKSSKYVQQYVKTTNLEKKISQTFGVYQDIYQQHLKSYEKLSNISINQIDQHKLNEAFIITFSYINKIANIYVFFRDLVAHIDQKTQQKAKKQEKIAENQQSFCKIVRLAYQSIRRINNNKFSLPMFTSDWNLSVKSNEKDFKVFIFEILNHQNNKKFKKQMIDNRELIFRSQYQNIYTKQTQIKEKTKQLNEYLKQTQLRKNYEFLKTISKQITGSESEKDITEQHIKTKRGLQLIQKIGQTSKYQPYATKNFDVHLVLQGVNHSNQCIGAYYYLIKQLVQSKQQPKPGQPQKQYIKAITCSNFHSIFGFLLVLGKDPEIIRKEMYHLKHLAATMEHQKNINQYFDQQQHFSQTPNKYAKVLKYLQQQTEGIFEQLQKKSKLNFADNSLKKQISEMRLLFQHEKQNLMSVYEKILDQTCEQIKFIDSKYLQEEKGNQIAKKYAFNYNCQHGLHPYSKVSQQSIKKFNEIIGLVYKSFGDLLSGIIANALSNSSLLLLNHTNAKHFVKGVVAQRLFTTYKLKEYIIRQLKEEKLSPNITLAEFYSVKRTIFLNFTVININEQRLDFLNKVTMPNMPVWAAIIASSSMPFFHKFFEGSKEWESTSSQNFYSYIIEDFFKTYQSKERITNYLSANYISSMPLELLTNSAVTKVMFADEKIRYLKFFGLAFNQTYKNPISDMKIAKNYFSFSWSDKLSFVGRLMGRALKRKLTYPFLAALGYCNTESHRNNAYKVQYPVGQYLTSYLGSGSLIKTKETLSESNDNFILKWYYNKLIRLPIKIDTLDFHQIVDQSIRDTYNINLPSVKAQQTIERSYEITKSFIDELKPTPKDKYKAIFRAQIMTIHHQITGFDRQHIKVSFLNHSKWNQNKHNNFVVEYATVVHGIQPLFKRATQSQILWLVEESSKLKLRFNYPQFNEKDVKTSKIMFTEFILDFSELIKRPSNFNKDSFDYQLIFAGDYEQSQFQLNGDQLKLRAQKMNKININWNQPGLKSKIDLTQNTQQRAKLICLPQIYCEVIQQKNTVFQNYYIQRSEFPRLPKEQKNKVDSKA